MLTLTWRDDLPEAADGQDAVRELLLATRAHDGRPEVEESGPLPREFRGGRHLLAWDGSAGDGAGALVGYAHLDTAGDALGNQIAELFVRPDRRRAGVGAGLLAEVLAVDHPLRIWSHGDHPAAVRLAERYGLDRVRVLHQMRLDPTRELPAARIPDHVVVRAFEPGRDEEAVVAVNARAFDWHPEQGQLTVEELVATEREPWFDPAGFFLAEQAGKIVGFHWTKVHPDGVGEVYVVGVDPGAQGGGLGKALTLVGLHRLRHSGVGEIILYVESDNLPAVTVYTRLGFSIADNHVAYQR